MTVGYLETSALVDLATPGDAGTRASRVWRELDSSVALWTAEFEVPSIAGRSLDRMGWMWIVNSLTLLDWEDSMRSVGLDLAWLGAPSPVALHVACAKVLNVDAFITSDATTASWAELVNLPVLQP